MIEPLIAEIFKRIKQQWSIGGKSRQPSEEDVQMVLDEAAGRLYYEDVGTRFETGGLIIEKRPRGHDVYIYVGNYL